MTGLFRRLPRMRWFADEAGVSAVEFSLLAPMLIFLAVATTDVGIGFYLCMQVESAAQAGAQYAILRGFDASAISSAVTNATDYTGVSASPTPSEFCGCASSTGISVSASCSAKCSSGSAPGTYVLVSAKATYTTLIGYPGLPSSYQLTAAATARLQ